MSTKDCKNTLQRKTNDKLRKPFRRLYDFLWCVGQMSGCHQMPQRSFYIGQHQFPVCSRCTGCFIGYALGVVLFCIWQIPLVVCFCLCLVMLIDWLIQFFRIRESTNFRRLVSGLLCGVGYMGIVLTLTTYIVNLL